MSPETALLWVGIAGLLVALPLGAFGFVTPVYKWFKTSAFGVAGFTFCSLGVVLVTSPKWTEVAIKIGDWETKISALRQQQALAESQLDSANNELKQTQEQLVQAKAQSYLALGPKVNAFEASWWKKGSSEVGALASSTARDIINVSATPVPSNSKPEEVADWVKALEVGGFTFVSTESGDIPKYLDWSAALEKIEGSPKWTLFDKLSVNSSEKEKQEVVAEIVKDSGEKGLIISGPNSGLTNWAYRPQPENFIINGGEQLR